MFYDTHKITHLPRIRATEMDHVRQEQPGRPRWTRGAVRLVERRPLFQVDRQCICVGVCWIVQQVTVKPGNTPHNVLRAEGKIKASLSVQQRCGPESDVTAAVNPAYLGEGGEVIHTDLPRGGEARNGAVVDVHPPHGEPLHEGEVAKGIRISMVPLVRTTEAVGIGALAEYE